MNRNVIFETKYYGLLIIAMFFSTFINAQENNIEETDKAKSDFWKNVRFGGGIGLGFGDGYTNIAVAPSAIYQFNHQFAAGIGLSGNYSKRKNDFDATVLGGSIIGLYKPIDVIQVSAEFEQNHVNFNDDILNSSREYWYPALFLGAGYAIGRFGAIGIRYDVLYDDDKSIYGSAFLPFVRVYF